MKTYTNKINFFTPNHCKNSVHAITNGVNTLYVNFFNGKLRFESPEGKVNNKMRFVVTDKFARNVAKVLTEQGYTWKDRMISEDFDPEVFFK